MKKTILNSHGNWHFTKIDQNQKFEEPMFKDGGKQSEVFFHSVSVGCKTDLVVRKAMTEIEELRKREQGRRYGRAE